MAVLYNKLFTKILDSSIWLEMTPTRIVWITLLAAMDRDGYAHFSAIGNLAARARVTDEEAQAAIDCFLNPDKNSEDQEFEGRRVERIPGGFIVLNAAKYRELVTSEVNRERIRERVRKFRAKKETKGNGQVLPVTQSEAEAETLSKPKEKSKKEHARKRASLLPMPDGFGVSERVKAWALENGFSRLDEHLEHFITQAKARAYVYADWDAALMNAIRKDWANLQAKSQRPKVASKSAQALDTVERLKRGFKDSDSHPDAAIDVPRSGGPARLGHD